VNFDPKNWLPTSAKEMKALGWEQADVVFFTGDAYIDHPAFGAAVIGRLLENEGLKVAIVPQPNWQDDLRDFKKMGKPKMFFAVSGGAMDPMINHYTANKRLRSDDAYTPGGEPGKRPDYATSVYVNILKKLYPDTPIVIGGIEASLRRLTHYDYWKDQLLPPILEWCPADILVYGMGELSVLEIVRQLQSGVSFEQMNTIPQTVFRTKSLESLPDTVAQRELNPHEACLQSKVSFAKNFKVIETESNTIESRRLVQKCGGTYMVVNPPYPPMTPEQIDRSFDLPYTRLPHPRYHKKPPIPAYEMIKFSVNMHRGCFGGCSFCTISAHQGKMIASRSQESILREVDQITSQEGFKGYITDLGGPSANMYGMKGIDENMCKPCRRPSCIFPSVCDNLDTSHKAMNQVYKKVRENPKIKKVTIGSGIRYDLFQHEYNKKAGKEEALYVQNLVTHHVSGRLKVAPEHTSPDVLRLMRKPPFDLFQSFKKQFDGINKKAGLNQQLIPYFISAHPESTISQMRDLTKKTNEMGFKLEQVQLFTPSPMTLATVMYYTGLNPHTLKPIKTAKSKNERLQQHEQFFKPHHARFKEGMQASQPDRGNTFRGKKKKKVVS
jgi:uncharacterized radical SAM protein YgiQ